MLSPTPSLKMQTLRKCTTNQTFPITLSCMKAKLKDLISTTEMFLSLSLFLSHTYTHTHFAAPGLSKECWRFQLYVM